MAQWDVSTGTLGATLRIIVEQLSQDYDDNTSVVRARLQALDVPYATHIDSPRGCSIKGIGSDYEPGFTWALGGGSRTIATLTRTVSHAEDGTLTLSVTGAIADTGTSGIGGPTTNGPRSFTLDPIPRIPHMFRRWDGTEEVHCTTAVRWDGTAEVPLTTAVRWDGTAEVPLGAS